MTYHVTEYGSPRSDKRVDGEFLTRLQITYAANRLAIAKAEGV